MEAQLRGINMAIRNNQDAVGLIQTAEAGLNEVRNMVLRIRELAVQMANGIYEDTPDRANAQLEVTALIDQVSLIAGYTRFNDISLLNGSFDSVEIQAGNTTTEKIVVTIDDMTASGLSIQAAINSNASNAQAAITTMDTALETIATEQATLGSLINRFNFSVNNLIKSFGGH